MIQQLVRKQILNMQEVNWGDIPDTTPFRLLWGENQQTLDVYTKAIVDEIKNIHLYPSATKITLRKKIATYNNVQAENIVVTNGSDEALELIAKVFIAEDDEIIMPVPSYPCFASVSQMMGAKIVPVALEKDFSLNLNQVVKIITSKTKIVWIANPNNPTGNVLLNEKQIEDLAKKLDCLLVIDECYFELSGITAAGLIQKYPNVLVIRSFSKVFALAGLRLGYIVANKKVTEYLNLLQQTNQVFNVNRFALAAGIAILSKPQVMKSSVKKFIDVKDNFEKLLKSISLEIIPTKTTFSFVKLPQKITGKALKEKLKNKNIYIKDCSIYENLGSQYIYLGISQQQYQNEVVNTIKNILEE